MFKCFKMQFLGRYYIKFLKRRIASSFYYINLLIPKKNNEIVAFIDYEMINGKSVPYAIDNVYMVCQYIENINNNKNITYIPTNQFGGKNNLKITLRAKINFFIKILRAKIILVKQPPHITEFFTKQQYLICFGYFIPFKADYLELTQWWMYYDFILHKNFNYNLCIKYKKKILKYFAYADGQFKKTNLSYIVSSEYSSKVLSKSHNLPLDAFYKLGVPKSDIVSSKSISIKKIFDINSTDKKIFIYVPTFRDSLINKNFKDIEAKYLTIFGYENENELEEFLQENNIIIIIKLHKYFSFYRELETFFKLNDKSYIKNCYFLDFENEEKHGISIYDLFEQSDAMIADYSSISFDYLIYDKPIIYNIPDFEEYRLYRGFSHNPIEEMMPGMKVKNLDDFKKSLLSVINNQDKYINERKNVLSIVNEIPKGKSLENIYRFINKLS